MTAAKAVTVLARPVDLAASAPIPIELLSVAPWNARKTFDEPSIAQMAQTLADHGLLVSLIVRSRGEGYEIVAGHRRYHAAKRMGWTSLRCEVRELTDDQAREVGLVDNLQREDVPALEEADAYRELEERAGGAAAIAARVGKDVSYVARRLKLVSLAELPRKALAEKLITIDHALLLARLGVDDQAKHLKWCLDVNAGVKVPLEKVIAQVLAESRGTNRGHHFGYWEPQSVLDLKEHIEYTADRKLSRAPWSLDDASLLPAAGACANCPSNTKANTALFADLDIDAATCADGGCFELKRAAFVEIELRKAGADAEAKPPKLVPRLSWKSSTVKPAACFNDIKMLGAMATTANPAKVIKAGQWVEAKKGSCPNVRPGVTVDWSDDGNRGYMGGNSKLRKPGEMLLVCIAVGCKAHRKEYEKPKTAAQRSAPRDEKAEREKRAKLQAAAIAESKLRVAVASEAVKAITKLPLEAVREMVIEAAPGWGDELKLAQAIMPGFIKSLKSAKADSAEFAKAVAVATLEKLSADDWREASDGRDKFLDSVKRLGWKGHDPWKAAAKAPDKPKPAAQEKKPLLDAAARKRIAEAQRKRWAEKAAKK